jgi:protein farnesyltransferase/geranylgeranyltransferase type-1 subunit alpha
MDELGIKYLKTYQVWHHRRLLLQLTHESSHELRFITAVLKEDAKNYHTWSHRQWVLAFFNDDDLWAGELDFVDLMLAKDVRNNSAWHHRFFVVFQSGVREGEEDKQRIIKRELRFVSPCLFQYPHSVS